MERPRRRMGDLDDEVAAQVERSLLLVRIVRGALFVVFLVAASVGVEAKGWPRGLTIILVIAALVIASRVVSDIRRMRR